MTHIVRVFERPDGSQVMVRFWSDEEDRLEICGGIGAMQVAEQPKGGRWGPPLIQVCTETSEEGKQQ